MSKTWYPIIDYDKCSGCLACYDKCTHGVYELNSRNFPKVVLPIGCVQGCTGCGSICPEEAITYMGDSQATEKACCSENEEISSCCSGGEKKETGCCKEEEQSVESNGCGCSCGCN